jgi:hypothetical protein
LLHTIDDFEVSIFLTDLLTRHSLLTKSKVITISTDPTSLACSRSNPSTTNTYTPKVFRDKNGRIKSNSGKLTGWVTRDGKANEEPIDVDNGAENAVVIREESDDEGIAVGGGRPKRRRGENDEDNEDSLFVNDNDDVIDVSEDEGFQTMDGQPDLKRRRQHGDEGGEDDKKKLGLDTSYDGFSIYGRILCLVVKRRDGSSKGRIPGASTDQAGQQMLENWVSTQAANEGMLNDDD